MYDIKLEKEMAAHSSVLAWRISGTGKPGGLPSMGSHRVGQMKRLSSSSTSLTVEYIVVPSLLKNNFSTLPGPAFSCSSL